MVTFVHRHCDFRLAELDAVASMFGLDPTGMYDSREMTALSAPYLVVRFPDEDAARRVSARCVLIKSVAEVWGVGKDYDELVAATRAIPPELTRGIVDDPGVSWACAVEGFGISVKVAQAEEIRARFTHVDFAGPVQCKDPTQQFAVVEQHAHVDGLVAPDSRPQRVFFCRVVVPTTARALIKELDLKKREYLGPTSMDTELSLIMANMGHVRPGTVVLDPFVGTGSILLACAKFGGFCFGADIDIRVLRGKAGKNVATNFDQYKLTQPEILRCDTSMLGQNLRGGGRGFFGAIVCDPPYGIRAGARKAGSRRAAEQVAGFDLHTCPVHACVLVVSSRSSVHACVSLALGFRCGRSPPSSARRTSRRPSPTRSRTC